MAVVKTCPCGETDCLNFAFGYPWCRSCDEHHRPPECPVDQQGFSLSECGCRWDDLWADVPHTCRSFAGDQPPDL